MLLFIFNIIGALSILIKLRLLLISVKDVNSLNLTIATASSLMLLALATFALLHPLIVTLAIYSFILWRILFPPIKMMVFALSVCNLFKSVPFGVQKNQFNPYHLNTYHFKILRHLKISLIIYII